MNLSPDGRLRLRADLLRQIAKRRTKKHLLDRLCRFGEDLVPGARFMVTSVSQAADPTPGDGRADGAAIRIASAPTLPLAIEEWRLPFDAANNPWAAAIDRAVPIHVADMRVAHWTSPASAFDRFAIRSVFVTPFASFENGVSGTVSMHHAAPHEADEHAPTFLATAANLVAIIFSLADLDAGGLGFTSPRCEPGVYDAPCPEDAVFVKDAALRYRCANEAAAIDRGRAPRDMEGLTDDDLFPVDVATASKRSDERVLATGRACSYEIDYANPQGNNRTYLVEKFPLVGVDDTADGILGVARDVTELRAAERAMQTARTLQYLGLVAGALAHDFNNALTGVLSGVDTALYEVPADHPAHASLRQIRAAATNAAELSSRLLHTVHQDDAAQSSVDLCETTRDAIALLRPTIEGRKEIVLEADASVSRVRGDPTRLRQVVMNLINNAAEAIGDRPGTVRVSVADRERVETDECDVVLGDDAVGGRLVRIACEDDGGGMPLSVTRRMFDPFFTTKRHGHGLGLAGVLDTVLEHRGRIAVRSVSGEGTRIEVYVPAEATKPD